MALWGLRTMSARAFEVVVICAAGRFVRKIIAYSSLQAGRDGINMVPQAGSSFLLICKPIPLEQTC